MEGASSYFLEDEIAVSGGGVDTHQLDSGTVKKPAAWTKPSNGAAAVVEVGAVMGAESWPALSESARASPKLGVDSPKAMPSHGSLVNVSKGIEVSPLSLQKDVDSIISNRATPTRQRSMKRGGGSSSQSSIPANGSLSEAPPMHNQDVIVEGHPPNQKLNASGEVSKDNTHRDVGQRGGYRRSNSGSQPRDGSYHGGRRDQERGKQDWGNNPNRSFGNREGHRVNSRGYMRGTAPNTTLIPPPLGMRPYTPPYAPPYAPPVVYTEMSPHLYYGHPDSLRPMNMFTYPPQMLFPVPVPDPVAMPDPVPDPQLPSKILNQINYYFSNENLVKDPFLRKNMDAEGWVPIELIAGFTKVKQMTKDIQLILDSIQASSIVEVKGDKVRRKGDWHKWILRQSIVTTAQSLQSLTLDDKAAT